MRARQKRSRIIFRTEEFDRLIEPITGKNDGDKATFLGVDPGNFSRIRRGQPVGEEFIAAVLLALPAVSFEQLFYVRRAENAEAA
jgi:hypothetical protein